MRSERKYRTNNAFGLENWINEQTKFRSMGLMSSELIWNFGLRKQNLIEFRKKK